MSSYINNFQILSPWIICPHTSLYLHINCNKMTLLLEKQIGVLCMCAVKNINFIFYVTKSYFNDLSILRCGTQGPNNYVSWNHWRCHSVFYVQTSVRTHQMPFWWASHLHIFQRLRRLYQSSLTGKFSLIPNSFFLRILCDFADETASCEYQLTMFIFTLKENLLYTKRSQFGFL